MVMVASPWSLLLLPSSDAVLVLLPPLLVVPAPAVGAGAGATAAALAAALPGVVVLLEAVGPVPTVWEAAGVASQLSSSISMVSPSSAVEVVLRGVSCGIGESVQGQGHKGVSAREVEPLSLCDAVFALQACRSDHEQA